MKKRSVSEILHTWFLLSADLTRPRASLAGLHAACKHAGRSTFLVAPIAVAALLIAGCSLNDRLEDGYQPGDVSAWYCGEAMELPRDILRAALGVTFDACLAAEIILGPIETTSTTESEDL